MSNSDDIRRMQVWEFMQHMGKEYPHVPAEELFRIAMAHVDASLADTGDMNARRGKWLDNERQRLRGASSPGKTRETARAKAEQLPGYEDKGDGQRKAAIKALADLYGSKSVVSWSAPAGDVEQHGAETFIPRVVRVIDSGKPVGVFRVSQAVEAGELTPVVEHLEPGAVTAGDAPVVEVYDVAERRRAGQKKLRVVRSVTGAFVFPGDVRVRPEKLAGVLWFWAAKAGGADLTMDTLRAALNRPLR